MGTSYPGLAGHRGLRGDILLELKRQQPLTAKQLADAFSVSANAVRRHLKELEAEHIEQLKKGKNIEALVRLLQNIMTNICMG